jgi:hypothetical protein
MIPMDYGKDSDKRIVTYELPRDLRGKLSVSLDIVSRVRDFVTS